MLYIHYTNYEDVDAIYYHVHFDGLKYSFESNLFELCENVHLNSKIEIDEFDWNDDWLIQYDLCEDLSCSIILESFKFSQENTRIEEVMIKEVKWIWDRI